jgi:hypothetical protein
MFLYNFKQLIMYVSNNLNYIIWIIIWIISYFISDYIVKIKYSMICFILHKMCVWFKKHSHVSISSWWWTLWPLKSMNMNTYYFIIFYWYIRYLYKYAIINTIIFYKNILTQIWYILTEMESYKIILTEMESQNWHVREVVIIN